MKGLKGKSLIVLVIILLASIAGNMYLYGRYKKAENANPDIQTQKIVNELKSITALPDETPSVLTVVDKSKLTDSAIAKNAENGDKILLFQKAGKVYIYRPSSHKLVNILNLSGKAGNPSQTQTPATGTGAVDGTTGGTPAPAAQPKP